MEPEDVKRITALDRNQRLCNSANERGKVWGWTYEQLGWQFNGKGVVENA